MSLAKKAIDARTIGGNYASLNRFGKIINNVKNSTLAGGIGWSCSWRSYCIR
jgi:hypothetical protein